MHRLIISTLIILLFSCGLHAQTPPPASPEKPIVDPDRFVGEFIDRLNGLDAWNISFEGKEEGVDQVVNHMMELFAPDVIAEVPPHDEDQIGPVMLMGGGQVRKWIDSIARTQVNLGYILRLQTEKEFEGALLAYSKPLPWGGLGISFQIIGNYASRQNRKRYMAPGAIFIQVGTDGKIHRLRLLLAEVTEVTG